MPVINLTEQLAQTPAVNAWDSLCSFAMNGTIEELMKNSLEAVHVIDRLALLGQATVFYAPPNGGKTLITIHELIESVEAGRIDGASVLYLNADDSYNGALEKGLLLEQHGIRAVSPGLSVDGPGFNPSDLADMLAAMTADGSAHGRIIILDTLKKFTDLMDKKDQQRFNGTVRPFITAGGTIIALAHTNKNQRNGKNIQEGTADIVADFDCSYVIEVTTPHEQADRVILFENTKLRGDVDQRRSFRYNAGEGVRWKSRFHSVEAIDEKAARDAKIESEALIQFATDEPIIKELADRMTKGQSQQRELEEGAFRNNRRAILDRWSDDHPLPQFRLWNVTTGNRRAKQYKLNSANFNSVCRSVPGS